MYLSHLEFPFAKSILEYRVVFTHVFSPYGAALRLWFDVFARAPHLMRRGNISPSPSPAEGRVMHTIDDGRIFLLLNVT